MDAIDTNPYYEENHATFYVSNLAVSIKIPGCITPDLELPIAWTAGANYWNVRTNELYETAMEAIRSFIDNEFEWEL